MEQALIESLIEQHNNLKNIIIAITEAEEEEKILNLLRDFYEILRNHVRYESEKFYLPTLETMRKQNLNTSQTEEFIKEMDRIAERCYIFCNQYLKPKKIDDMEKFKQEMENIKTTLTMRIESEETGIFLYSNL